MLRITPSESADAAKRYYCDGLARPDYYMDGQELPGIWGGKAATGLGLSGQVEQAEYFALCDNLHPQTGGPLTPRQKGNRRVGFDFTYSAPKSVSVMYELSGDERILDAFRESVRETMNDIEAEMKTRVRVKGADYDRETGNMVWAEFVHFTGRPVTGEDGVSMPDPHLHSHCYAFNVTFDEAEKRFKAGQFGDVKRDGPYWEAAFDARFSHRLKSLGYPIEKRGLSFEIAGTPQSLIDKNSRRRNEIVRKAAERGISDAEGKHAIGYYEREHKNNELGRPELRRLWEARLSDRERTALSDAIHGRLAGDTEYTAEEAKEYALAHAFENASAVSEKRLKAHALKYAVGSVLPESVSDIARHPEVIAVKREGQLLATTRTVLKDEVSMLQFAKDGQRKFRPLADVSQLGEGALAGLSEEQRKAALHVLMSRDTVTGVVGKAGTGKTRMMRTTVDAIEGSGQRVFVFAPSSQASRGVLKKEGFQNAETLEMLLTNERLQEQTRGQVLWVDEAGLISSRDMRRLMDVAGRNGNRVILSGDYTQHASVEAGDAFRLLEKEAGVRLARLTEIRRQTEPKYRKAVEAIASGTGRAAQKGLDALDAMGCVIEARGEERHRMLLADYMKAAEDGKSALIIAPTHAEGERLTQGLRRALEGRGALGAERTFIARRATGWTDAQKGDARNYQSGMVIEFHQNAKGFTRGDKAVVVDGENGLRLMKRDGTLAALPVAQAKRFEVYRTREIAIAKGDRIRATRNGEARVEGQARGTRVNNGDIFTVEGFTKEGDIRIEKGKLLPKDFGHIAHGYVDTSYASQGKTVDRVFIAAGNESLPAVGRQQWYVSASRGREMARLYVDSKEDVRSAVAKDSERLSAVELTRTRLRTSWRHRFRETLERNRVARFLTARANAIAGYWRGNEGMRYA
jgi:conjugative relaxase-like TrwC/TraI family protein